MTFLQCVLLILSWASSPSEKSASVEFTKEQKCRAGAWSVFGPGHCGQMYMNPWCVSMGGRVFPMANYGWSEGQKEPTWRAELHGEERIKEIERRSWSAGKHHPDCQTVSAEIPHD